MLRYWEMRKVSASDREVVQIDPRTQEALFLSLLGLRRDVWAEHEGRRFEPADAWDHLPTTRHLAVLSDGEVVAGSRVTFHDEPSSLPEWHLLSRQASDALRGTCPPIAYLGRTVVMPEYRGTGLAKLMDSKRAILSRAGGARTLAAIHSGVGTSRYRRIGLFKSFDASRARAPWVPDELRVVLSVGSLR